MVQAAVDAYDLAQVRSAVLIADKKEAADEQQKKKDQRKKRNNRYSGRRQRKKTKTVEECKEFEELEELPKTKELQGLPKTVYAQILHLDRAYVRRPNVDALVESFKLNNMEVNVHSAMDGEEMNMSSTRPFGGSDVEIYTDWEVKKDRYALWKSTGQVDADVDFALEWWARPATVGELACSYSHLQMWNEFLESGADIGLFMEDDLEVGSEDEAGIILEVI